LRAAEKSGTGGNPTRAGLNAKAARNPDQPYLKAACWQEAKSFHQAEPEAALKKEESQSNMNAQMPKQQFVETKKLAEEHRRMVDSEPFVRAVRAAREQYTRVMCNLAPTSLDTPNQLQASAMCFQRIQGVNDFINILVSLADPPPKRQIPETDNLNHKP
jgi:hypothetical protein